MAPLSTPDLLEWHAVDAPFRDVDDWFDSLAAGICTSCGGEALAGDQHWWHQDGPRLCPDRGARLPQFSADLDD